MHAAPRARVSGESVDSKERRLWNTACTSGADRGRDSLGCRLRGGERRQDEIAREILGYFMRNPKAVDTLEGIARWRLLEEVVYRTLDETQEAVEWLVKHGALLETPTTGYGPVFRLNAQKEAGTLFDAAQDCDMPSLTIDAMDNAALWTALAPDGVTPSTELSLAIDTSRFPPGAATSARVTGSANALNHTLRRSFAATDLTQFNELRLWIRGERPADGTPGRPFFLEMRMASAAIALSDAANTWQRYLPVSQAGVWEPVRVSIADLPGAVRSDVTVMQLRCASAPFACNIDEIIAVRDDMVTDVDQALLGILDKGLTLGGNAVAAVLHPANGVLAQARPYLEITNYDILFSRERTDSNRPRVDYTDKGYTIGPASNAYELYYQVKAVADDRASQSQMLDFTLRALPARGGLLVNGVVLPMEAITVYAFDQPGGVRTEDIPLFYRISVRQETGPSDLVSPARTLIIGGDIGAPA